MCKKRSRSVPLSTGTLVYRYVFLTVLAGYAIFCYTQAATAYSNLVQIGTDYTNLIESWDLEVVTDIKRSNVDCDSLNSALSVSEQSLGEYRPLFQLQYPGFKDGCDCR